MKYKISNKRLQCTHCDGFDFSRGKTQLNVVGISFRDLDWESNSADTFSCNDCGRMQWFASDKCKIDDKKEYEIDCLSCGKKMVTDDAQCPSCGWSYK